MHKKKKVLALLGSTKQDSFNLKILQKFMQLTESIFAVEIYPLGELPYFNPDLDNENTIPISVVNFRNCIETSAGIIICTPEYVFSLPGILKNALEWTVSTMLFHEKPTALITASSSGDKAHESLELVMKTIGAKVGDQSSILIKSVKTVLNEQGEIKNPNILADLNGLIENFKATLEQF
ncbi:MAG: NAD(P)H-dependent oxidoreductase [Methylococcaceae bacterium]|nr:NAD(P)H-dependent oxidoreductase [Methylococcaceae bacterium]